MTTRAFEVQLDDFGDSLMVVENARRRIDLGDVYGVSYELALVKRDRKGLLNAGRPSTD
jgi:hypothetical protein